jgi:hypothetical protein
MDLATLGIRVESQEAAVADKRLDDLTAASARAEKGVDRLADAARRADSATGTMNVAVREQTRMMGAAQNAMGLTANESLNLSRQFADVGVTLAMGMNPAMVALQQGPQLMDIFAMSAARAGTSIRTAMLTAATGVYALMAPFLPLIAAVAAAAAVIGGGLALAARGANKEFSDLEKGLGLTDEQLKKVKDSSIGMGDIVVATFQEVGEAILDAFDGPIKSAQKATTAFLDELTANTISEVKVIVGSFVGAYGAIRATWSLLPAALGDAAYGSANAAVDAINWLIRKSVEGVNSLRSQYNSLPAWMRGGQAAPMITAPQLGGVGNPYAGGMRAVANVGGAAYRREYAVGEGYVDAGMSAVGRRAEANEIRNIRRQAGDDDSRGGSDADAVKKAREVVEILQQLPNINLQPLNIALISVVDPLRLIADEMRLIDGLAQETAQGLASAFGETGRALGDLLTTMSGFQSRMAEINLAEKDHQITAQQAERERAYATIANYGDMLGAAKGFFQEGSEGYRFLQAAEAAYRVFQFAMSVQAMAQTAAETAASVAGVGIEVGAVTAAEAAKTAITVAGTAVRTPLKVAEGAAGIFATLGPFAFPVVAAMIALLATLGMKGGGGKGGGGGGSTGGTTASVSRSQGFNAQQDQARTSMLSSLAQKVEVKVTADREGIHAYVAGVAEDTARPMIVQGVAAGSGATRAQVAQDMDPTYRRGRG